ncbi:hypothetical protein [Legionella londiniensis]|uniref:hypothetical protein n=1 Tax=Legionella londiniensis TaxID=45068 RepID=UPI00399CB73E
MLPIVAALGIYGGSHLAKQLKDYLQAKVAGKPGLQPEDQEKLLQKFADSIGVTKGYSAAEAFNTLAKNHVNSLAKLAELEKADTDKKDEKDGKDEKEKKDKKEVKKGEFTQIHEKLEEKIKANDENAKKVKQALEDALALSEPTQKAQKEYSESIAAVNDMIKDQKVSVDQAALASYLQEAKSKAVTAIKEQHGHELEKLKEKFEDAGFKESLKNSLEYDDEQLKALQEKMINSITESQKKELEAFEKSSNDAINNMHLAAQQERDKIAFIALQYEKNKAVRDYINGLQPGEGNVEIQQLADAKKISLKGIKVEDLPTIETITGRKIQHDKASNTFTMDLPNRYFNTPSNLFYHSKWRSARKADMMSLAQAVKACGYGAITMTITHNDPEHVETLAKEAYAACLESGFPPDKIRINATISIINEEGKKVPKNLKDLKGDELTDILFKNDKSTLKSIQAQAEANNQFRKQISDKGKEQKPTAKNMESFRETLDKYRKTEEAEKQKPVQQPTQKLNM